jgi:hypothetical protein
MAASKVTKVFRRCVGEAASPHKEAGSGNAGRPDRLDHNALEEGRAREDRRARNLRNRAARMGRNPTTGEPIQIKASKRVAFRATKELKMAI